MATRTPRLVAVSTESTPPTQPPERFTPAMPDDGRELMMTWEIPAEEWDRMTVKTCRFKAGTQQLEVLFSCVPTQWALEYVAQRYGPGSYRIQAGPGPYRTKNTTVNISREYAQEAGWESAPPMTQPQDPGQQMAARTFLQATQGAVDPLSLSQMIAAAVESALAKRQPQESGLDSFLKGFTVANDLSLKAMDQAKAMLGIQSPAEQRKIGWPEVIMQMAPGILGTLQQAIIHRDGSRTLERTAEPQHQEAQPMPQLTPPPPETVPLLNIMRQYAGTLTAQLANPQTTPEGLAEQLSGLIGPDLDPSVMALAQIVSQHGPAIMGHADPALATQKAAETLIAWARIIANSQAIEPD